MPVILATTLATYGVTFLVKHGRDLGEAAVSKMKDFYKDYQHRQEINTYKNTKLTPEEAQRLNFEILSALETALKGFTIPAKVNLAKEFKEAFLRKTKNLYLMHNTAQSNPTIPPFKEQNRRQEDPGTSIRKSIDSILSNYLNEYKKVEPDEQLDQSSCMMIIVANIIQDLLDEVEELAKKPGPSAKEGLISLKRTFDVFLENLLNSNTFQSGRFYNGKIRHIQTLQPKIEAWFDIQIEKQSNLSIKAYFIETAKDIYSVKGAFQDFFYRATLQSNQKESIRHHQKAISLENFQENGIMAGSKYVSLPPNSTNDLACNPTENPIGMLGVHFNNKSFNGINSVSTYLRISAEKFRESAINKEGFELATQGHLADGKLLFLYALLANQVNRIELFGSRHTLTSSIFQFQEVLIERLMLNTHTTIENMLLNDYFQKLKDETKNSNFRGIGTNLETIEDIPNTQSACYPNRVAKNDYLGKHWITTLKELNHARMDYKTFRLEMQFKAKERLAHFNQNSRKYKSEANEIDQDLSIQNQNLSSPASMSSLSLDGPLKGKNNLFINDDNPIVDHSMQSDDDSIRSIDQNMLELALLCYRLNLTFNDLFLEKEASQDPCIDCFKKYLSQLEILFGNGNNRAALHNDEDINAKPAVEPNQATENDDSADDDHSTAKNVITINQNNKEKIDLLKKGFQTENFTFITISEENAHLWGQSFLYLKVDKNRIFTITELEEYHQELHKLEKLLEDSEINDFNQYVENELSKVEDLLEHINITDNESLAYKQLKASNQAIDQHNKVMDIQLHQLSMQYDDANEKIEALKHEKQKLQRRINTLNKIQNVLNEDFQTAGDEFDDVTKNLEAHKKAIDDLGNNLDEIKKNGEAFVSALLKKLNELQENAREAQTEATQLLLNPNKDDESSIPSFDDVTLAEQCKAILDNHIKQSNAIIAVIKENATEFLASNNETLQKLEDNVKELKQLTKDLERYIAFIQKKLRVVIEQNKTLRQQLELKNAETAQLQQAKIQENEILNSTITIEQFKDTVNEEYYSTLGSIIHVILCILIVGIFIPRERSNTMKALKEIMDSKQPGANVSFGEIYDAMGGKDAISSRYNFFNPGNDKSDAPGTHKTDQTLVALKQKFMK